MTLGLDLDGVLADIVRQLILFAANEFGLRISPQSITSENVEQCTPLTGKQLVRLFSEPSFFTTMPAMYGAAETVAALKARQATIHIITDRFWYPGIQEDTAQWLNHNNIVYDSLVFARKAEKQHAVSELAIDAFLEDQRSNANLIANVSYVFLLDCSYNQGPVARNVYRVSTLAAAAEKLLGNPQHLFRTHTHAAPY